MCDPSSALRHGRSGPAHYNQIITTAASFPQGGRHHPPPAGDHRSLMVPGVARPAAFAGWTPLPALISCSLRGAKTCSTRGSAWRNWRRQPGRGFSSSQDWRAIGATREDSNPDRGLAGEKSRARRPLEAFSDLGWTPAAPLHSEPWTSCGCARPGHLRHY